MTNEQIQTVNLVLALLIAPIVGWPIWLILLAIKRVFDTKTDNNDFTPASGEEVTASLIGTLGDAGYTLVGKLEELLQKGK